MQIFVKFFNNKDKSPNKTLKMLNEAIIFKLIVGP